MTSIDVGRSRLPARQESDALLMRQSADTIKKLSLELGGNAPLIVFDDADQRNNQSTLSQISEQRPDMRLRKQSLCQEGFYNAYAEKLVVAVKQLKVSNSWNPACKARSLAGLPWKG